MNELYSLIRNVIQVDKLHFDNLTDCESITGDTVVTFNYRIEINKYLINSTINVFCVDLSDTLEGSKLTEHCVDTIKEYCKDYVLDYYGFLRE